MVLRYVLPVKARLMTTPTPTILERHLSGEGDRQSVTPLDAFRAARRHFLRSERVDMQELAAELGVSRTTLYRWVGSRDQLIGEILWSLTERALEDAKAQAKGTGAEWLLDVYRISTDTIPRFEPLRHFVEAEPEAAMRAMMSRHSAQQRRLIGAWEQILVETVRERGLKLKLDTSTLAFVMVRVGESFLWTDLITGEPPDVNKAYEVVRVLIS